MERLQAILSLLICLLISGCVGTKDFPIKGIGLSKCEVSKPPTNVSYQDVEYYTETEPYQTNISYIDRECNYTQYTEEICTLQNFTYNISYDCSYQHLNNCSPVEIYISSYCEVDNLDSEGGNFTVQLGFSLANISGNESQISYLTENKTSYIDPQSSKFFEYTNGADVRACNSTFYSLENLEGSDLECLCTPESVPNHNICVNVTKTKEDCRDVPKNEIVTRYRAVTKNRTVTKTRMETNYSIVEETC